MPNKTSFDDRDLATSHWVKFNVQNNKVCYVLTGIFIVDFKGNSSNWLRQRITFGVPIPDLPRDMGLHIELWAPLFTLSSVFNAQTAVNSGHAIENFDLIPQVADANHGTLFAFFYADVAAREIDAYIHRIGYNITLTGTIKPLQPLP